MHSHGHGHGHDHGGGNGQGEGEGQEIASKYEQVFLHDHGEDDDDAWEGDFSETYLYSGDSIELTTVGIDIGSSTSHLIFSRLKLRRLGQNLSTRYVVISREVLHASPIMLTPYNPDYTIDADTLQRFIHEAYEAAGLTPGDVDTGAVILTGEAVKRTNARAIADLFASETGKFVCVSAGHNLEAVMAAHGSGAAALSRNPDRLVMNVDVGGGTSKLALVRHGEVLETSSINVGGRLVALDEDRRVTRIEPAARMVAEAVGAELHLDEKLSEDDARKIADKLADCLMEAVRREPLSPLAEQLMVTPSLVSSEPAEALTFSGGVSEYLYEREQRDFGDLAIPLATAIRARIEAGRLPAPLQSAGERIRATVIGASQFTVQVSGNTINISDPGLLPLHNIQVLYPRLPAREELRPDEISTAIQESFRRFDLEEGEQPVALAIDWHGRPAYPLLRSVAEGIAQGLPKTIAAGMPVTLVFQHDVGKLIGYILRDDLKISNEVISIDNVDVKEFDFIDIGEIIYPARAVPVVIKSLVFPHGHDPRAELLAR
jgi:ethanolamine utilization protein EutA